MPIRSCESRGTFACAHLGREKTQKCILTPTSRPGVRPYFEVRELDNFCRNLQHKGFHITQLPRMMPWRWRHAYLNEPDGHEISSYWAGENRMKKTVTKAAQKAARA